MSLKVLETLVPEKFPFGEPDKYSIRTATDNFSFRARCRIDGVVGWLDFMCMAGMQYNGASNKIGWPIKNYYGDPKKDVCGLGHDLIYAWGGQVVGLDRDLKAGEGDDYIRGSMREAGWSRVDAGVVDRAVRIPIVHWLHFGKNRDKENMHVFSKIMWVTEV